MSLVEMCIMYIQNVTMVAVTWDVVEVVLQVFKQ